MENVRLLKQFDSNWDVNTFTTSGDFGVNYDFTCKGVIGDTPLNIKILSYNTEKLQDIHAIYGIDIISKIAEFMTNISLEIENSSITFK